MDKELKTAYAQTINYFGNAAALARALGISSQAVSRWNGVVNDLRAYQIEVLTGGRLRHDELRPDQVRNKQYDAHRITV